jgi:RNA polymerase sigma factor (sigma-70 family)
MLGKKQNRAIKVRRTTDKRTSSSSSDMGHDTLRGQMIPPTEAGLRSIDADVRQALAESHHALLRFLTRRLGSPEEAEEVLSTFYVRSLSRASDIRNLQSLRGWLRRVLETTIADYYRKRAAFRKAEVELDEARTASRSDTEGSDRTICTCFYKLLPTLKPEYAEVIRRVDLQKKSREKVATSLGTTVNNLTVRLHRARSALRRRLEQTCLTCPIHGFFDCCCDYARRMGKVYHTRIRSRRCKK